MVKGDVRKAGAERDRIRVLVADDHVMVREGLVSLLNAEADFEVVGEAGCGEEAVRQAEQLCPDAVVMDMNMPIVDGVEATRRITTQQPETVILGMSLQDEDVVARAMIEAGARGYLSKQAASKDLVRVLRRLTRHTVHRQSSDDTPVSCKPIGR